MNVETLKGFDLRLLKVSREGISPSHSKFVDLNTIVDYVLVM